MFVKFSNIQDICKLILNLIGLFASSAQVIYFINFIFCDFIIKMRIFLIFALLYLVGICYPNGNIY